MGWMQQCGAVWVLACSSVAASGQVPLLPRCLVGHCALFNAQSVIPASFPCLQQPLQSMGPRKGGGRSGFVKAARSAPSATESGDVVDAPEKTIAAPEKQAAVPSKAAAFLKDPEPADSGSSDEEGTMTRGKVLQRHKRVRRRCLPLLLLPLHCFSRSHLFLC